LEAWQANRELVEGEEVRLERDVSETDRYGRLLRYVYVDDVFVNAELVRQGLAEVKSYPPDTKYQDYFEELEALARNADLGIWAK
jgi:micrococcal nuclease